jgi:hypothetical protein
VWWESEFQMHLAYSEGNRWHRCPCSHLGIAPQSNGEYYKYFASSDMKGGS